MKTVRFSTALALGALVAVGPVAVTTAQAQDDPPQEPPACSAQQVSVSYEESVPGDGGPYIDSQRVVVTNTDPSITCSVYGSPQVTALAAGGAALGTPSRSGPGYYMPIELVPGQKAIAEVRVLSSELFSADACQAQPQWGYRIADPDGFFSVDLPVKQAKNFCTNPDNAQIIVSAFTWA